MSSAQDKIVTAALLLSESAWLTALFGVVGLMLGEGISPLGWLGVIAILGSSLIVSRTLQMIVMPAITAYALQMIAGVLVVYLTVGSQLTSGYGGVDLGWLGRIGDEDLAELFLFKIILGSIFGVLLWVRGGFIAGSDFPGESLSGSFKIGLLVLALAAVVDIFQSADINVYRLMFVFFAAAVVGMSAGHVLPASNMSMESKTWVRVIGLTASVIMVVGLFFSLLSGTVLIWISTPIKFVLDIIGTIIFYVIIVPLAFIMNFILSFIINGILAVFGPPPEEPLAISGPGEAIRSLAEGGREEPVGQAILQIIQYSLLVLIVVVALFLLAKAFRRRMRWRRREDLAVHESISEDMDPLNDLGNLLLNMLPSMFKRKQKDDDFRVPDDDQSIVDVFRIYFGMLTLAAKKGIPKPREMTPVEYQSTLEGLFPTWLVRTATDAFNRACYGHHPASREDIDRMRVTLEQVVSDS